MEDVKIPGEPAPTPAPWIRRLTVLASGLTAASIAVNLILQVAHFMKKRPMEPDQRDRIAAAGLGLTILRNMPGLIKQTRLFVSQLRGQV
ncbi:MAG: hypothetical protein JOZ41_10485 [Chloroflexi bacterium]|nr:hypothetical protein [Chloroflexota bacterium]